MAESPQAFDHLGKNAYTQPNTVAVADGDHVMTYWQYISARNKIASALRQRGIQRGDRIVVYGHNSLEWVLTMHATAALAGILVPCNWHLSAEEVGYVLENSTATVVFVDTDFQKVVQQVRPNAPNVKLWITLYETPGVSTEGLLSIKDLIAEGKNEFPLDANFGTMFYTGGTTGKPKAAIRSKRNPAAAAWLKVLDMDKYGKREFAGTSPAQSHLVTAPLYHSAPNACCAFSFMTGGTVVIMRKFNAEQALRLIEKWRIQSAFMPPILLKRTLDLPDAVRRKYDTSSLRNISVSGAPCPIPVKEATVRAFGNVLYEFYGSSEMGINTFLRPEDVIRKLGSCGVVAPGVELAVFDDKGNKLGPNQEGELFVRRNQAMFDGYFGDKEKTAKTFKGEWGSVGDVALIDEDGYVFIRDRKIDMIISGGVNIYPAEIENCLHRMPEIADVAVFGVPDDEFGERVHAAVQLRPGAKATANDVIEYARARIARFKAPKEVSFHAELPRTEHGKILKRLLREPYWASRKSKL